MEDLNKDIDIDMVTEDEEEKEHVMYVPFETFKSVCDVTDSNLEFATKYQKMVFAWYRNYPKQHKRIVIQNFDEPILNEDADFLRRHGIIIEGKQNIGAIKREYVLIVDKKYIQDITIDNYISNYIKENIPMGNVPTSVTLYPIYSDLDSHRKDLNVVCMALYEYVVNTLGIEALEDYTTRIVDDKGVISVNCLDRQQTLFNEKIYDIRILESQKKHAMYGKTDVLDVTGLIVNIKTDLNRKPIKIIFKDIIDKILAVATDRTILYFNKKIGTENDEIHFNNLGVFMDYKYGIPRLEIDSFNSIIKTTKLCFSKDRLLLSDQINYLINYPTVMVRPSLFAPQSMITVNRDIKLKVIMTSLNNVSESPIIYDTLSFPNSKYKLLDVNSNDLFNLYKDDFDEFLNNHNQLLDVLNKFRVRLDNNRILSLINTFFLQDESGEIFITTVDDFNFTIKGLGVNYGLDTENEVTIDNLDELSNWIPADMLTDGVQIKTDLRNRVIIPLAYEDLEDYLDNEDIDSSNEGDDQLPTLYECLEGIETPLIEFQRTMSLEDYLVYVYGEQYLISPDHRDFVSVCLNYNDCIAFRKPIMVNELRKLNVFDKLNVFGCFDPILRRGTKKITLTAENFARR